MSYKVIHAPVSPSSPNHMILPVIIYQENTKDAAALFKTNGWHSVWENGVFDYHHFHPNTHEVLAVKSGHADLMIGGENGQKVSVTAGDVLLLPAGYGHKRLSADNDFKVIGAYPTAVEVKTETSYEDINAVNSNINSVPLPDSDPVFGSEGPMFKEWHNLYHCNTVKGH